MKTLSEKISAIKAFCNEGEGGRDCSNCPLYHYSNDYCYYEESECIKYHERVNIVERNYEAIQRYKAADAEFFSDVTEKCLKAAADWSAENET